jgi:hypothetical protein
MQMLSNRPVRTAGLPLRSVPRGRRSGRQSITDARIGAAVHAQVAWVIAIIARDVAKHPAAA